MCSALLSSGTSHGFPSSKSVVVSHLLLLLILVVYLSLGYFILGSEEYLEGYI